MQAVLQRVGDRRCCVAGVFEKDGRILLGQRNYTADVWKDKTVWTIPGGRSEEGETIEETLRRETAEEVGIDTFEIVDFIADAPGADGSDIEHLYLFRCTTDAEARLMEPHKFSEWRWVPLDEYCADEQYHGFNEPAREMIVAFLRSRTQ